MQSVLVTGASGTLGRELTSRLIAKGVTVYALARKPPEPSDNLVPLKGDITIRHDFGVENIPTQFDAAYHLAALLDLGWGKKEELWRTNVEGTFNVLGFCVENNIPHLYFVSTAYTTTLGRNPYELSKMVCERNIEPFREVHKLKVTIFKPSILTADSQALIPGGAFYQVVGMIARVHRRAELVRRKVEGTLHLPVIEPVFRIKGNPQGYLNLIPVDAVAEAMAEIEDEGTFWLTNPEPPKLSEIAEWVGEALLLKISFKPEFKPMPIEALFERVASPFLPYLWGDNLRSDLKTKPRVDKEYIQKTVLKAILA